MRDFPWVISMCLSWISWSNVSIMYRMRLQVKLVAVSVVQLKRKNFRHDYEYPGRMHLANCVSLFNYQRNYESGTPVQRWFPSNVERLVFLSASI